MKKLMVLKLTGLALLSMVTLVILSFIEVAIYSYLIDPGQENGVYEAHAEVSAPFVSAIGGFIIFFLIARFWKKRNYENGLRLVILFPIIYMVLDVLVLTLAGFTEWQDFILVFLLSLAAKALGCYLGWRLTGSNSPK